MIAFAKERLTPDLIRELEPMLFSHYAEVALNQQRVKLNPRWQQYLLLQAGGKLHIHTARDDGFLVGYNAFLVDAHLHYAGLVVAFNDVFYVDPEYRKGTTPLRLLRYTEQQFAGWVDKIAYHHKAFNNFGPILHRLGYAPEEGVAAKLL